jgi:N-methylhydantoinase B
MVEKLSPVVREIIANRLNYVTQEMGLSLARTAYSVLFAEDRDYSCTIFDHKGYLLGLASFVCDHQGGTQGSMEYLIKKWGLEGLEDGDILMHNDALYGGCHPPDITVFKPVFYQKTLVAIACCVAHHNDTGGMRPSSYCPDATEIYQEGIRFPAVKLFRKGELQKDILDTYLTNVRGPESERGDLWAQLSTFPVAEKAIKELCDRYGGAGAFIKYTDNIQDHSEQRMRDAIRKNLKEGVYEAEGYEDHDGWEAKSWKIKVKLTVKHKPEPHLVFDFTGTDPQAKGFVNSYFCNTRANVWPAVYVIVDPYIYKCYGCMRAVEIIAPEGTIVNAKPPAPIGACTTEVGTVIQDVCLEALGKARPEAATGIWGGTFGCFFCWGKNPRHIQHPRIKEEWLSLIADPGAMGGGARVTKDGMGCVTSLPKAGPITMPNVEIIEQNFPILYKYRRLITDGGGPGKFRGSPAYEVLIVPEADIEFTALANKGYHGAPGVNGGKPGSLWRLELRDASSEKVIKILPPKVVMQFCKPNEGIYMAMPGGGGYGNPFDRNKDMVLKDVLEGYVSIEHAKEEYGVVIDPKAMSIDEIGTKRLRGS